MYRFVFKIGCFISKAFSFRYSKEWEQLPI